MAGPTAELMAVGRVRRPHGLHGEVRVEVETDFPERVTAGIEVGLGAAVVERSLVIEAVRTHKGAWLLSFAGVASRNEVEAWRGWWLFLPAQERSQLPANYYYEHELAGLRCISIAGAELGEVKELALGGAAPLLVVQCGGREVLVPFISPLVVRVDLAARTVVVDPPAGLFDGDAL
ncbi:MAG: ribosome maturation factor RimM [Acidobacteriota bacterium]